jgi:hypothetical protein
MAHTSQDLERLARELSELSPEERARVLQAAQGRAQPSGTAGWRMPVLKGGTAWVGGSLRREDMYGDDGR